MPRKNKTALKTGKGWWKQRQAGVLPPKIRKFLSVNGNKAVTGFTVVRVPIEGFTSQLLEYLSIGTYVDAIKSANYDQMFHLAVEFESQIGTFTLEKNAVITLTKNKPYLNRPTAEREKGALTPVTWSELFENTRNLLGDEAYTGYDARTNNCQDFVLALLKGNHALTPRLNSFIKQDAEEVFRRMPAFSEKLVKKVTDLGAVADVLIQGQGGCPSATHIKCVGCGATVRKDNISRHKKTLKHQYKAKSK